MKTAPANAQTVGTGLLRPPSRAETSGTVAAGQANATQSLAASSALQNSNTPTWPPWQRKQTKTPQHGTKKRRHGVRWYGRWLANRTVRFLTGLNLTHSKRTARNDQLPRVVGLFSIYPDKKKTTKNVACRVMRRAASYHIDLAKQTPHGELTCARTPTASVSLARPASPQDEKLPITTATTAWR